ncbi:hypothetical protein L7F22_029318 [Adiantum nelumboides]|nr:hypothetical protein [Adiantum nelumboides]
MAPRASLEAWYMDDSDDDQRLPHHLDPKQYVSLDKLAELGVLHWVLDADSYEQDPQLAKIRQERGYTYHDICDVAPDKLMNYENKLKSFFEEHIHTDEEIRFVIEAAVYLDTNNYIKVVRLFVGEPVWTPYNRPQDENPAR